jgi:tripartite-type tricarboxylate transporter receptor subunit TctC
MIGLRFLLIALLAPTLVQAQSGAWPAERPIRLIVPFQPGSSSDSIARVVAQRLSERLSQQIVIDNRVGASSMLGTEAIVRAAPDGYTIGLANTTTHASAPVLTPNSTFDPIKDFSPVGMIGSAPFVLLSAPKLPASTVAELIALARKRPQVITYASAGPGTMAHLSGALFERLAEVKLVHVPYRGTGQSMVDLMENRIELLFGTIAPSVAHVRAGKMRALATTGTTRNPALPEVPTMGEAGLKGYEAALWTALVLPTGASGAVIERLNRDLNLVLASAPVREALEQQGVDVEPGTPAALAEKIRTDAVKWREVITSAGIRAE